MRPVDLPDDAVVVRFSPTLADRVLRRAQQEYRRVGVWGLSVFAAPPSSGEGMEDVVRRLLAAAELDGMNPANNRKYFVCTRAEELRSRGFTFYKYDERDDIGEYDELPEHYSVDLGSGEDEPTEATVVSFLGAFDARRWEA